MRFNVGVAYLTLPTEVHIHIYIYTRTHIRIYTRTHMYTPILSVYLVNYVPLYVTIYIAPN